MKLLLTIYTFILSGLCLLAITLIISHHVHSEEVSSIIINSEVNLPVLNKPNNDKAVENSINQNYKEDEVTTRISCTGNWFRTGNMDEKIKLGYETLSTWNPNSKNSILTETLKNENKVILGHNECENGDCYSPTTDFAQIIETKEGEPAEACINGEYFRGTVDFSGAVHERAVHILGNWRNSSSITAFTCYGECKDINCNSVKERWVVSFTI